MKSTCRIDTWWITMQVHVNIDSIFPLPLQFVKLMKEKTTVMVHAQSQVSL